MQLVAVLFVKKSFMLFMFYI